MADSVTSVKAVGNEVYTVISDAIGDDTVTFATNYMSLVVEDFTPSQGMAVPDRAGSDGLGPITSSGTTLQVSTDPLTGDLLFKLKPPAGGWYWTVTNIADPPVTVYGWVWTNTGDADVMVAGKLETPITFDVLGQSIGVDSVEFRIPAGGLQ